MAFKVVRQPGKIALIGYASSAAALHPGSERAPEVLRAAGISERLKTLGFGVSDFGDTALQPFQPDDDHPRARNVSSILKALQDLRPRVEAAVKSGALPLILSGDSVALMAAIAGVRRYYRMPSLIYMSREADLQVPAATPNGFIDGMVLSQVIGRGAPELTRFWGEPPLVREPDITLFGHGELNSADQQYLLRSPLRRYSAAEIATMGAAAAVRAALQRIQAAKHEFVVHLDVDVISHGEFVASRGAAEAGADGASAPPTNGTDMGLAANAVCEALREFARQSNIAAINVAGYSPALDPDGNTARRLVDLLADALASRLQPEPAVGATVPAPILSEPSGDASSEQASLGEDGSSSGGSEL